MHCNQVYFQYSAHYSIRSISVIKYKIQTTFKNHILSRNYNLLLLGYKIQKYVFFQCNYNAKYFSLAVRNRERIVFNVPRYT